MRELELAADALDRSGYDASSKRARNEAYAARTALAAEPVGEAEVNLELMAALIEIQRLRDLRQTPAAPPAPEPGEVGDWDAEGLVSWLWSMRDLAGECNPDEQRRYAMTATLLEQQLSAPAPVAVPVAWGNFREDGTCVGLSQHPEDIARWQNPRPLFLAAPVPVAVSERLPEPEDCNEEGYCWSWDNVEGAWYLWHPSPPYIVCPAESLRIWLPFHAILLPQVVETGP